MTQKHSLTTVSNCNMSALQGHQKGPKPTGSAPAKANGFDYSVDFDNTDFRGQPELYQIGSGEQGVLSVQPYKGEILPHWQFKTPVIAQKSSAKILELFEGYRDAEVSPCELFEIPHSIWQG